jgi:hypothetical protein
MLLKGTVAASLRAVALIAIAASIAPAPVTPPLPATEPPAFVRLADGPRISVPSSIDATGRTDASAKLQAFLARVPDRSTIVFKAGGTYRLDKALRVETRNRLTFDGQGAILRMAGCDIGDSAFVIDRLATNITIRKFLMVGDNAGGGTTNAYREGCEYQAGVAIYSGKNVEIANVSIIRTNGECIYLDGASASNYAWTNNVWFHDSVCKLNGRSGIGIVAATKVVIERVHFYKVGMHVFNIEPDNAQGGGSYVSFRKNTVDGYGMTPQFTNWFVAAEGADGSTVHDLTISGNRVTNGAPKSANTITEAGLATTIAQARRQRIVFKDNTTTVAGDGPVLHFHHVDGLTVSGNIQPLRKGSIAKFVDCSEVTFS